MAIKQIVRYYGDVHDSYDATSGVMDLLHALYNGNDPGTGIRYFSIWGTNLLGPRLPQIFVDYSILMQNNLFGDYPKPSDVVPSAIFAGIFLLLMVMHLGLYIVNLTRKHYFHFNLFWAVYCATRAISFVTRITWSYHIINVDMGLANEILLVISSVLVVPSNLILTQRLFTWRHPVGGSRRLFTYFMWSLYALVAGVVAMTVVASVKPYITNLSVRNFLNFKICVMVSAVLIIVYSLTAIFLLLLSYFFKPTRKDENLYTYQPWWIESFHPFYFVKKGAKEEAEETFMKRNHNHRHAIRVIAATHHHYNMVEGLTNQRGNLEHNKSILIISISTLFLFVAAVLRAIVVFQSNKVINQSVVAHASVMYVFWGGFEVIINLLFLFGRVDLRFYRPDKLPKKVRSIITAEQSVTLSRIQSSDESYDDDDDFMTDEYSREYTKDKKPGFSSNDDTPINNGYESKLSVPESVSDNESEFHF
ncbi:hypothetical protein CLIB1444_01S07822 [[Candida] jaroonii]|uniref:Uncharacterized protein n=1 Tax=[Candida] jaroonii TaxID=467808 RepID=A0ACA9Y128_9ASCO|nr:hypothetical protein CLIB1444_01S07822 [[Candida] jaroonii]